MSKVVVFGATGWVGGNVTAELLSRGHEVVGVARDTSSLEPAPSLTVVAGSLHDPEFVASVVEGADAVVIALPARAIDGKKLVDAIPTLVQVSAQTGARVGVVGGAGSLRVSADGPQLFDTPDFPDQFKDEAKSSEAALQALEASDGANWFYLSPAAAFGSYNPGVATGAYRVGGDVLLTDPEGNSDISGADFALALVDELETPAHKNTRFSVAY